MRDWQTLFLTGVAICSLYLVARGFWEINHRKNAYGRTPWLTLLGIFVWGDAVAFGVFWAAAAGVSLALGNWYLFLLFLSVFWMVRGFGETQYWFNQQFSTVKRDPPESLDGYKWVKSDAIWFMYQTMWQVVTIVAVVATIYMSSIVFFS